MADNIESLEFQYLKADGTQTLIPNSTTSIQVTITARTKDPDPTYSSNDGFRRRQIVSTIQLRNMGRGGSMTSGQGHGEILKSWMGPKLLIQRPFREATSPIISPPHTLEK